MQSFIKHPLQIRKNTISIWYNMKILQILHLTIENLYTMCFHRYRLILISCREEGEYFVLLWFGRISSTRLTDGFRGLADDRLSRTLLARFRVPSASQVSAFTLRSQAEISRASARARARGFLWDRDRVEPRAHRTSSSNRSATISTTWRSFHGKRTSRDQEQKSSIFRKLRDRYNTLLCFQ